MAERTLDRTDRLISAGLFIVCMFTRLYRIGRRPVVSWDETHFGKFGAYYINRTFYHDVHPPLAKMLVGLSEYISGHNGSFAYSSGAKYPEHINYTFQRTFLALFGVMIVPFAYRTCRCLRFSRSGAFLAASFVLFDNALCVMSRFILLDPILWCFTSMSLLGYAAFTAHRDQPFSAAWWRWLVVTGVSLGLVVSSKWVGLLTVALIGLCTVEELFAIYSGDGIADEQGQLRCQFKHWAARVICLILVPLAIYLSMFQIHFAILNRRGTGDYKMPSLFQARQRGSVVAWQPHQVAFGSYVTLRSHLPGFGLIHANESHSFPDGNQEVVAAGIGGKQKYNWWRVVAANQASSVAAHHIRDGALVGLVHNGTGRYLRTGVNQPFSVGWDRRMFVDGNPTTQSLWGLWRIKVVNEASPKPADQIYPVTTSFRLFNAFSGCLLQATNRQLPSWGRHMSELICTDNNSTNAESTVWNIEQVRDSRFKKTSYQHLAKRNLIRDTIWLNREMALSNSRLIPDHDRYKHTESPPWTWPLLLYPMRLVAWSDRSIKYYEVGNPLLWWASSVVCCVIYPLQLLYWMVGFRRNCSRWKAPEFRQFWHTSKLLWGGWALHYFPFLLMARVTYIHHYLSALYFALLLLAYEIQCVLRWYAPKHNDWLVVAGMVAMACAVFCSFSPLTFGWDRPIKALAYLRLLPTWNLYHDANIF